MNLAIPEPIALAKCRDAGVSVSSSEPLPDGGTHLVCTTMEGADEMRLQFQDHLVRGIVRRHPFYAKREPL